MRHRKCTALLLLLNWFSYAGTASQAATIVDFENVPLPTTSAAGDYYNGSDLAGGFFSGGAAFFNDYNPLFDSWSGWAASNSTDMTDAAFTNQYSAFPGGGAAGSEKFGVAFDSSFGESMIVFAEPTALAGSFITNGTYPALAVRDGSQFSKKFGGLTGNDPDWFKLEIFGKDRLGNTTGTVEFYLADYRFADNSQDKIVDTWEWVDLTTLGTEVKSLEFALSSTDNGMFGMNTPAYFLMDNLTLADADFNSDSVVDALDLTIWQTNLGASATAGQATGDSNGDTNVDGGDFLNWQRQLDVSGVGASGVGAAGVGAQPLSIPEPTTLALIAYGFVLLTRPGGWFNV